MTSRPQQPRTRWSVTKVIGAVLAFGGILISIYHGEFSKAAPNLDLALGGSLVFAVGIAILLVQRFRSQRDGGEE